MNFLIVTSTLKLADLKNGHHIESLQQQLPGEFAIIEVDNGRGTVLITKVSGEPYMQTAVHLTQSDDPFFSFLTHEHNLHEIGSLAELAKWEGRRIGVGIYRGGPDFECGPIIKKARDYTEREPDYTLFSDMWAVRGPGKVYYVVVTTIANLLIGQPLRVTEDCWEGVISVI